MKQFIIVTFLFFSFSLSAINLIPLPREYETLQGVEFRLDNKTRIRIYDNTLQGVADWLATELEKRVGYDLREVKRGKQAIYLTIDKEMATEPQSFFLSVEPKEIFIAGHDAMGVFYGAVTLLQAATSTQAVASETAVCTWPIMIADDAPYRLQRGIQMQACNALVTTDSLQHLLDEMAYYKLNTLFLIVGNQQHARIELSQGITSSAETFLSRRSIEPFTANEWAKLMQYAGARYITIVPMLEVTETAYQSLNTSIEGGETSALLNEIAAFFQTTPKLYQDSLQQRFFILLTNSTLDAQTEPLYLDGSKPIFTDEMDKKSLGYLQEQSLPASGELLWCLPYLLDYNSYKVRIKAHLGI